jgi:hypothetical protein
LQISQDISRYVMFGSIRCDTGNYVFDIYCLDDADESNEESESRVTSRLRWNCRAALGTGMREVNLSWRCTAGEGGDDEDEDDDDSTTKAGDGNDYPDEDAGAWLTTTKGEDLTTLFECDPRKHEDAAAWDDDDGEEEKIDLTTLFECDGNATRKTTMALSTPLWNS